MRDINDVNGKPCQVARPLVSYETGCSVAGSDMICKISGYEILRPSLIFLSVIR